MCLRKWAGRPLCLSNAHVAAQSYCGLRVPDLTGCQVSHEVNFTLAASEGAPVRLMAGPLCDLFCCTPIWRTCDSKPHP